MSQVHCTTAAVVQSNLRKCSQTCEPTAEARIVVWLAQMVAAMSAILGDHWRIRTGRMWRWCKMAPPPRRVRANQNALRLCRSRLCAATFGGRGAPCWRVSGNVLSGRLGGREESNSIQ